MINTVNGNIVSGTPTDKVVTQVQTDFNAVGGLGEILNKASIQPTYGFFPLPPAAPAVGNVVLGPTDFDTIVRLNMAGGLAIITLPLITAASKGHSIILKNTSASITGNMIAAAAAGNNIDGLASRGLRTQFGTIHLVSDGNVQWIAINGNIYV